MNSIPVPKTLTIYMLARFHDGIMTPVGDPSMIHNNYGIGFYTSQDSAEHQRTLEYLKDSSATLYIFPLEIDNPAYKGA